MTENYLTSEQIKLINSDVLDRLAELGFDTKTIPEIMEFDNEKQPHYKCEIGLRKLYFRADKELKFETVPKIYKETTLWGSGGVNWEMDNNDEYIEPKEHISCGFEFGCNVRTFDGGTNGTSFGRVWYKWHKDGTLIDSHKNKKENE